MDIQKIFELLLNIAHKNNYSDIHLNTWSYPVIRDNWWDIIEVSKVQTSEGEIQLSPLSKENIIELEKYILGEERYEKFYKSYEIDTSYHNNITWRRYRVNCYKDTNWDSIAMRTFPEEIPDIDKIWLWEGIKSLCKRSKWLILITWPTGSGKSTNLASMIEYINTNLRKHIITIEDPVEFVFKNKKSIINQREVWVHTKSFSQAMKSCLREDPDIIMVGEMRDPETIKAAITLAETWHLVLSTLHTNDTVQSIDRIIDVFPSWQQEQVRMQLAMSLSAIVAQRLVPKLWEDKRIAAREVLISNDAVRNLIITGNTHQIYSVIEVSGKKWMILMDAYLMKLFEKWLISKDTLMSFVRDKENIEILAQ